MKTTVRSLSLILAIFLLAAVTSFAQAKKLTTAEAKHHIGEQATVCGKVVSAQYAATTDGKPTFLYMDHFTVVILGENRDKFGSPEKTYREEAICVSGKITDYKGTPEVVVDDPQMIEVKKLIIGFGLGVDHGNQVIHNYVSFFA
jgi:DNA/RNA endonuclease YhcR with UshA esterase domain